MQVLDKYLYIDRLGLISGSFILFNYHQVTNIMIGMC